MDRATKTKEKEGNEKEKKSLLLLLLLCKCRKCLFMVSLMIYSVRLLLMVDALDRV